MCTCIAKFNSTVYSLSLVLFTGHTHTSKSTDCWPNCTRKCVSIIIILLIYLQLLGLATMAIGIWAKVRELFMIIIIQ